jgi:chromosome segregation ATPase
LIEKNNETSNNQIKELKDEISLKENEIKSLNEKCNETQKLNEELNEKITNIKSNFKDIIIENNNNIFNKIETVTNTLLENYEKMYEQYKDKIMEVEKEKKYFEDLYLKTEGLVKRMTESRKILLSNKKE